MTRNLTTQSPRLAVLLVFFAVFSVFGLAIILTTVSPPDSVEQRTVQFISNGTLTATVSVEIADTPEERQQGLMGRTDLPENHGMLFVYEDERPRVFWMKQTEIPLDIIFLDAQKRVINVEQADPEPGVPPEQLERYTSDRPAQYVIELEQGFSEQHGIGPDTIAQWRDTS